MVRWLTSGESHGSCITGIIDGIPAGLTLEEEYINYHLQRRQKGYGRSARMQIPDKAEILSGLNQNRTTGAPLTIMIRHRESAETEPGFAEVWIPRPGHADDAGRKKYRLDNFRPVIERASARETAMRVALGSVARKFLEEFSVYIASHVVQIGQVRIAPNIFFHTKKASEILRYTQNSQLHVLDREAEDAMEFVIHEAQRKQDSIGGIIEIVTDGLPVGLGSYRQWDCRLSGLLMQAIGSIPGCKGVEIGDGFAMAAMPGSECADVFIQKNHRWRRKTNHAGGIEGGMTNGEPLILRAVVKPVPTIPQPLPSYDIRTDEPASMHYERADTCVVNAFGVVAEAMVALTLINPFLEKFGGDSIEDIRKNWENSQRFQNE